MGGISVEPRDRGHKPFRNGEELQTLIPILLRRDSAGSAGLRWLFIVPVLLGLAGVVSWWRAKRVKNMRDFDKADHQGLM